jgi:small subunit ribosomal protein S6
MYILASSVSDDQVPTLASQIVKFVSDFGGSDITETQMGKKKLAYPVKKTRNGFYGLVNFEMDSRKINDFDAKIRTQDNTIIRYIIVNMDEHIKRSAKDVEVQSKMNRTPQPGDENQDEAEAPVAKPVVREPVAAEEAAEQPDHKAPAAPMNAEELDKKIDEALNEDIIK